MSDSHWSLKKALTLNFVLLACLPIMIVGFVSMKYLSVSLEQEVAEKNLLLAIPFEGGMLIGHLSLSAVYRVIDSIQMAPGEYVAVVDDRGTTIPAPIQGARG